MTSFFAQFRVSNLVSRTAILGLCIILTISALTILGAVMDDPDRLRSLIPKGVSAGEAVYNHTDWFSCAVAVFKLDEQFAAEVREKGLLALGRTDVPGSAASFKVNWKDTPVLSTYGMEAYEGLAANASNCLNDSRSYKPVYRRYINNDGGYFAVNSRGDVTVLAPGEGLIFVVGSN